MNKPQYNKTITNLYNNVNAETEFTDVVPASDNIYYLGMSALRWKHLYAVDATISGSLNLSDIIVNNLTVNTAVKSDLKPETTNTKDLGSSSNRWKLIYVVNGDISGDLKVGGYFDSNVIPKSAATYDLGSVTLPWNDLYVGDAHFTGQLTSVKDQLLDLETFQTTTEADLAAINAHLVTIDAELVTIDTSITALTATATASAAAIVVLNSKIVSTWVAPLTFSSNTASLNYDNSTLTLNGSNQIRVNPNLSITTLNSTGTTDATSTSTGSIVTAGGLGVAKAVYCGSTLNTNDSITVIGGTTAARASNIIFIYNKTDTSQINGRVEIVGDTAADGLYVKTSTSHPIVFQTLGSTVGRWNTTGQLQIVTATDSSSTTTGSLITAGGMGVVKNIYTGGNVNIAGSLQGANNVTTNYLGSSTGSRLGINTSTPARELHVVGIGRFDQDAATGGGTIFLATTNAGVPVANYALSCSGNTDPNAVNFNLQYRQSTVGGIVITTPFSVNGITSTCTFPGPISSTNTTDASSTSTGAIITAGGLGVAKAIYGGSTLNIAGTATFTSTVSCTSGLQGTTIVSTDTTTSTSTSTGAITTAGGIGVAKRSCFGDIVKIQANQTASTNATYGMEYTLTDTTLLSASMYLNTLGLNFFTGTQPIYYRPNNTLAGQWNTTGQFQIVTATDSSSTTTGSLITAGGLGVAKAIYGGSTLNIAGTSTLTGAVGCGALTSTAGLQGTTIVGTDTTDSTSSTSGAMKTAGGLGVAKAIYGGSTLNIGGSTNATSQSTGSIITSGGIGVAKDIWVNRIIENYYNGGVVSSSHNTSVTLTKDELLKGYIQYTGSTNSTFTLPTGTTLNTIGGSGTTFTCIIEHVGGTGILTLAGNTNCLLRSDATNIRTGNGFFLTISNLNNINWVVFAIPTSNSSTQRLYGTDSNETTGPSIYAYVLTDINYPVFNILNYTHDNCSINFDCYYGSGSTRNSHTSNGWVIQKTGGNLIVASVAGGTAGTATSQVTHSTFSTSALTLSSSVVLTCNNTTDSTSTSTGALIVSGGVAVSKNIYCASTATCNNLKIGSSTTPNYKIALTGFDSTILTGPHLYAYTTSDQTYPLFNIFNYTHDNCSINFDCYYDGATRNSHTSTGWAIQKTGSNLVIGSVAGGTAGTATSQVTHSTFSTGALTLSNSVEINMGTSTANRRIVLYNASSNAHQFYGFGINGGTLRYQVDSSTSSHVFYSAASSSSSTELLRLRGNGIYTSSGVFVAKSAYTHIGSSGILLPQTPSSGVTYSVNAISSGCIYRSGQAVGQTDQLPSNTDFDSYFLNEPDISTRMTCTIYNSGNSITIQKGTGYTGNIGIFDGVTATAASFTLPNNSKSTIVFLYNRVGGGTSTVTANLIH